MKFILFFAFLICVVAAFDFDLELITPATTKGKDEVFVSSTVETLAVVTTAPATTPTTTATTASTTTVRTTTEKEDEEQIRSKEGSTITSTFGTQNIPKVEVIVTRSIYRLMDEAFRQHLNRLRVGLRICWMRKKRWRNSWICSIQRLMTTFLKRLLTSPMESLRKQQIGKKYAKSNLK